MQAPGGEPHARGRPTGLGGRAARLLLPGLLLLLLGWCRTSRSRCPPCCCCPCRRCCAGWSAAHKERDKESVRPVLLRVCGRAHSGGGGQGCTLVRNSGLQGLPNPAPARGGWLEPLPSASIVNPVLSPAQVMPPATATHVRKGSAHLCAPASPPPPPTPARRGGARWGTGRRAQTPPPPRAPAPLPPRPRSRAGAGCRGWGRGGGGGGALLIIILTPYLYFNMQIGDGIVLEQRGAGRAPAPFHTPSTQEEALHDCF